MTTLDCPFTKADRMVGRAYDMFPFKHEPSKHIEKPFPMYSFERAASQFWYAFTAELFQQGLGEDEVEWLLKSKQMRWMFDGEPDFGSLVKTLITPEMLRSAKVNTNKEETQ